MVETTLLGPYLTLEITGDTPSPPALKVMGCTLRDYLFFSYPLRPLKRVQALFPAPKICSCISANQLAILAGLLILLRRKTALLPKMYYLAMTYLAKTCFTTGSSQLGLIEERSPVSRFPHRFGGALARILSSFSVLLTRLILPYYALGNQSKRTPSEG